MLTSLFNKHDVLVPAPAWHKLGMVAHAYDTKMGGGCLSERETGGSELNFSYILNLAPPGLHQCLSQKEKQKTKMGREGDEQG